MALGLAPAIANAMLDSLCRAVSWTPPAAFCVQLHTADPGASGTTAIATETTRKAITCSAASGGGITNSADVTWASVLGTETFTHVSFWSATSGGTFLGSDDLVTPVPVIVGDPFTIVAGDLDLVWTPIAA